MKAKFTYSVPVIRAQVGFSDLPVFMFCDRLSMFRAAHQRVAEQPFPAGQDTQPGG